MKARAARGGLAAAVMMGTIVGCSGGGDDEVERSAESFCGRWAAFESGATSGQEMFSGDEAQPEFLRELADRSPDPDLAAALDEMAALSPGGVQNPANSSLAPRETTHRT